MSRGNRMRRVNSVLREAIADHVADLKDPRLGFVTVTEVDTSPDLRGAIVYFSVIGTEEEKQSTLAALTAAASKITTEIGGEVRMKYTPKLEFRLDEALERGIRMSALLHDLEETDGVD